jgi:hypothetical protein
VTTPALSKAERRAAKETVGDKITSGSLEIHFSLGEPILQRPLYFHHIPKTAGTSFRASLRSLFRSYDAATLSVPHVKHALRAEGRFPEGLIDLDRRARQFRRIELFASHYTADLAYEIGDPIVSFFREPESHRRSYVAFHAKHLADILERRGVETLLERTSNLQAKSLMANWGPGIPSAQPAEPDEWQWPPVVDRIIERFTLFRTEDYGAAMVTLAGTYGFGPPATSAAKKVGTYDTDSERLLQAIEAADDDQLWLDRMIYERINP